jgi:hypothetical protein
VTNPSLENCEINGIQKRGLFCRTDRMHLPERTVLSISYKKVCSAQGALSLSAKQREMHRIAPWKTVWSNDRKSRWPRIIFSPQIGYLIFSTSGHVVFIGVGIPLLATLFRPGEMRNGDDEEAGRRKGGVSAEVTVGIARAGSFKTQQSVEHTCSTYPQCRLKRYTKPTMQPACQRRRPR